MNEEIAALIQACEWFPSQYLLISENVFDSLIYYSHLGVLIPVLGLGLFIILNGRKDLPSILLFITTVLFSAWILCDSILWATEFPTFTFFFWTLEIIFEPLIYFFAFYFFYTFSFQKDLSGSQKLLAILPVLPILILASTRLGLLGYDLTNCDRDAYEGALTAYGYGIEILYASLILISAAFVSITRRGNERRRVLLVTAGITAFLLSFSLGNIVGVFTDDWSIGQYGLFGAPVFVAFLAYTIVRYKAFNVRLIGAQVLVAALWLMVLALLFIPDINYIRAVTGVTLIFVLILGILLVRGVYREIEQRERIEKLAAELERANQRQVTLIHFISHQIKGFVSKSRNIFATMLEGDYGPITPQMKPILEEGLRSDTQGVATIQDILNASNIKSGKVTYTMAPFDLKQLIDEIATALRPAAETKGLAFNVSTEPTTYTGDRGQLVNVFKNMIDNSVKYTPKGEVNVILQKDSDKIHFEVNDTGVGIDPADMKLLFTEGGHGKDSQKVNVESTGFGLYIVKNIVEAHKGKVWAESEGCDKGSRFIVELPTN